MLFATLGVVWNLFSPSFTLRICNFWTNHPQHQQEQGDSRLFYVAYSVSAVHTVAALVGVGATWMVYQTARLQYRRMQTYRFSCRHNLHNQQHPQQPTTIRHQNSNASPASNDDDDIVATSVNLSNFF